MRAPQDRNRWFANSWLRCRVDATGRKRGLKGYYAFAHGERPAWWTDETLPGIEVLGVYEGTPSSMEGAIAFTPEELFVLGKWPLRVRYDQMERFGVPSKEPISRKIETWLVTGEKLDIPIAGRKGPAFSIQPFLEEAAYSFRRPEPHEDTTPRTCPHCHTPGTRFRVIDGGGRALVCPACSRSFKP
jgi:hypothetical protein